MNPYSGQVVSVEAVPFEQQHDVAAQLLGIPDPVLITGTEESVRELSRRVRLGATELDRRKARRRQQAASRRANR